MSEQFDRVGISRPLVNAAFVFFSGVRSVIPVSGYRANTQHHYTLTLWWDGTPEFDEAHPGKAAYLVDDAPPAKDGQVLQLLEGKVIVGAVILDGAK